MRPFCLLISIILASLLLQACGGEHSDLVVTAQGCGAERIVIAPTQEPTIVLASRADTPMVVTIPTMNRWLVVQPGGREQLELPRYIMGSFDFFCLEEAEHTRISGGNPFLCSMEPGEVAPFALSRGILEIEPHNRIEELGTR